MKRVFTFLFAIAVTASVLAQSPQKMSYQAVIRNSSNQLVTSHAVGMRVSILQGSASGTAVYTETITPTPTTNANGLVSIEIGGGSGFDAISWASGPYFIKTETDPAGGTTYTITGTSQLLSVPYALYASKVANLSGTNAVTTTGNQTVAGNKTFTGTTTVATPVNATDAATKAYVDTLISQLSSKGVIVADADGNIYSTVRVGSQVWMAENLKTTKYRDGSAIPNVTDAAAWAALTTDAYADYNNTPGNSTTYGKLYNYYTVVDARKLCPTGWHVPTDAEFTTLTDFLGGESVAGGKLKELGTAHWNAPNTGADNTTGFTALAGGYRGSNGTFVSIGSDGVWWSATESGPTYAWYRILNCSSANAGRSSYSKESGYSVRCVRD